MFVVQLPIADEGEKMVPIIILLSLIMCLIMSFPETCEKKWLENKINTKIYECEHLETKMRLI